MIVGADSKEAWTRSEDGRCFADVDAAIAATHIILAVQDLGLGTVWVGHFDAPALQKEYPQMKNLDLIAAFPIGHPAKDAHPSEKHTQRKEISELVEKL